MRCPKIAKLVNAPAIHHQKIVVSLFQILPAAHRAHTEALPQQPRPGLFSPPAAPTEPSQVLCLVRACLPPSSTQSTLSFNGVYKNREKTEVSYSFFHSAAHRFKKMRFSKIANLVNAPAIHNLKMLLRTFQIPSTQSLCPSSLVKACFPSSSQRSPRRVFASSELVLPPSSTHSTLSVNGIYNKNGEKKRKSVILFFTQLHLVSKKMRVSKIANLVNAPIIHKQKNVVRTY